MSIRPFMTYVLHMLSNIPVDIHFGFFLYPHNKNQRLSKVILDGGQGVKYDLERGQNKEHLFKCC